MLIDWFTVGAQALNFLILVWLMKRFLYKPVLNAIDLREKRIAAELADADVKRASAQKDRDDLQKKNEAFDTDRNGLLRKAVNEANAERDRLLAQARKDADGLRATQATALRNDQLKLGSEITRLTKDEAFEIARKALADLATVSLEERMAEVFTRRLRQLSGQGKETLAAALKASPKPAVLTSAFDLPAEQKAAIQNALNETFSAEVRVQFQTKPNDSCGIELSVNGQRIAWSVEEYLASLNRKLGALLDAQSTPPEKATPKPETAPALVAAAQSGGK